jgi:hypothetical protein
MKRDLSRKEFLSLGVLGGLGLLGACASDAPSTTAGSGGRGGTSGTNAGGSAGTAGGMSSGGTAGIGGAAGGTAGSGGSKVDPGACSMMGAVSAISLNHEGIGNGPHYLAVSLADILAGVELIYETISIPGTTQGQGHSHYVKLTSADFAALRAGMTVTKRSCDAAHEHQYAFRCGTMPDVPSSTACMPGDDCGGQANEMADPC